MSAPITAQHIKLWDEVLEHAINAFQGDEYAPAKALQAIADSEARAVEAERDRNRELFVRIEREKRELRAEVDWLSKDLRHIWALFPAMPGKTIGEAHEYQVCELRKRAEKADAELAALKAKEVAKDPQPERSGEPADFAGAIRELRDCLAELAKERARLDWLEQNPIQKWGFSEDLRWLTFNGEVVVSVRAAIDAAREESK